jgi:hypothetical protein
MLHVGGDDTLLWTVALCAPLSPLAPFSVEEIANFVQKIGQHDL